MAEEEEESILYDLLVPAEWTVEPEPLVIAAVDLQFSMIFRLITIDCHVPCYTTLIEVAWKSQ